MSSKSKIDRFREKFRADYGEGHYYFACHAAFPVGFTVDLLYQLWANFKDVPQGSIDRLAVSDLLQSDLCRITQRGIFEMELEVRNALLEDLRRIFGKQREQDLARFLYQYADDIQLEDIPVSFRDTQKMIALGTLAPNLAVERLAQQFNQQLDKGNRPEIYRMDSLLEALLKQDQAFENLRNLSKGIRGTMAGTELTEEEMADTFGKVIKINPSLSNIAEGVRIALPEHLREQVLAYRREISQQGEVEALKRIREARENAASELDLSNLGLTYLPEELFGLSQLETLDLYDNALTEIPLAIARLTNLEKLMASQNQLTTLPESLAELKQLKTVKFDSNQLGSVPEVIFSLENLEDLSLENNGIEFLPPEIQKLSKLRLADLRENPVYNIPQGRKKFTRGYLQELWSPEGFGSPKSAVVFLVQAGEDEAMLEPIRDAAERGMIEAEVLTFHTLDELYNRCRENAPHEMIVHLNLSNTNSGRLEVYLGESPIKIAVSTIHQLLAPLRSLRCMVNTQAMSEEKAREIATGNVRSIISSLGFSRGANPYSSMQAFYERLAEGQSLVYAVGSEPVNPDYEIFTNPDFIGIGGWGMPSTVIQQQQQSYKIEEGVEQFRDELLRLVEQNSFKELFTQTKQHLIHKSQIFDEFILLEARYQRLDEDNISGLLPQDLYGSELDKIRKSLLQAVQRIIADDYTDRPQQQPWDQPGDGQYGGLGALKFHLKKLLIDDLDVTFAEMQRSLHAESKVRVELQTLEQQLDVFNRQARGGSLDPKQLIVNKNQIVLATLEVINQIEEGDLNSAILVTGDEDANIAHPDPIQIFLSYAEADQRMVESLKAEFKAQPIVSAEIYDPYESIAQESNLESAEKSIEDVLHEAEMVISIISPAYLESEYCQREMQVAARRADAGDSILMPVIYRNCDWQSVPALAQRQVLPGSGSALNMTKDLDGAVRGVANQIGVRVGELVAERNRPAEANQRAGILEMPERTRFYLALQGYTATKVNSVLSRMYLNNLSSYGNIDWDAEQNARPEGILKKLQAYREELVWFHYLRDDNANSSVMDSTEDNPMAIFEELIKAPFLKVVVLDRMATNEEVNILLKAGIPAVIVSPPENVDVGPFIQTFYEEITGGSSFIDAATNALNKKIDASNTKLDPIFFIENLDDAEGKATAAEGIYAPSNQFNEWRLITDKEEPEADDAFSQQLKEALLQLNFVRQKYSYEEKQRQIQHPITILQGRTENAPGLLLKALLQISEINEGATILRLDLGEIDADNWGIGLSQQLGRALNVEGIKEVTDIVEPINQRLREGNVVIVGYNLQKFRSKDWVTVLNQLYELFFNDLDKTPNRLLIYFMSEETLPQLNKVKNPNLIALPQISPLERPDIDYWLKEPAEKLPHDLQDRIRKEVEAYFRKEKTMPIRNFVEMVTRLAERPQLAEGLLKI